jgi:hypothetical protein
VLVDRTGNVGGGQTNLVQAFWLEFDGNTIHGLADTDNETSMNDKLSQFCTALITVTTVPYEEFCKMAELLDGEIGGKTCLTAFLSNNSNSDIRGLNHRNIIASITDATDSLFSVLANQFGNVCFLGWRTSTGDDRWQTNS